MELIDRCDKAITANATKAGLASTATSVRRIKLATL